jgi:N-methylhydantoinase B
MIPAIDPITEQVINELLISIVREMRATMIRSAYSSTVYEMMDFSCALFDPAARMVAQAEDLGSHVIPMPATVRAIMAQFGGDLAPGDVIMLNDPYHAGTHLNDVSIVYPLFVGDELILFPANRAHWDDVGGSTPGSMSGRARDVWQEGLRIPPLKIYEQGKVNQAALDLIFLNMRVPDERRGDFRAMMATCRTAERRIGELVAKYGLETIKVAIDVNMRRGEARMRQKIRALPNGEYIYEDYLEFYGSGGLDPVLMRLTLTVRDDEVHADFGGSSAQVPGPVNSTLAVTTGGVVIALKSILDPEGPINHGSFVPIRVSAPEGTIVNAIPPAPVGSHGEIRKRAIAVTLGAIAQAAPELVAGDMQGTSNHNMIGGLNPRTGRPFVYYECPIGGNGGFAEADGPSVICTVDWGGDMSPMKPAEVLELEMPLRIERTELEADSAGPGRRRGGLGVRRQLRILAEGASYSVLSDRAVGPPYGVLGGMPGQPNRYGVERRDGALVPIETPGKISGLPLRQGDLVTQQAAGGGGYGDPLEREPAAVARDVAYGYVTVGDARAAYGVVLGPEFVVDQPATARQRDLLRARRTRLVAAEGPDEFDGQAGRHRVLRLHPDTLAALRAADGDLLELVGPGPAPLRGWLRADPAARPGSLPLGPFARRVLRVDVGGEVELRVVHRGMPVPVTAGAGAATPQARP